MADTGERRYSKKEALNRIVRIWQGKTETDDTPETALKGEILSEDHAMSQWAEMMADSMAGEMLHLPRVLERDFGGIYTWTGTVELGDFSANVFTKITGAFQNDMRYYGTTPQYAYDRITLSQTGYYFVSWSLSYLGSSDVNYKVEPYHAALGTPQAAAQSTPYSSGTITNMAGSGFFIASGSAELVDLRLQPNGTAWIVPLVMTLSVERVMNYE